MEILDIIKIAMLGLGLWAIEEVLKTIGAKDHILVGVKIGGTLIIIAFIVGYVMDFLATVETLFVL